MLEKVSALQDRNPQQLTVGGRSLNQTGQSGPRAQGADDQFWWLSNACQQTPGTLYPRQVTAAFGNPEGLWPTRLHFR